MKNTLIIAITGFAAAQLSAAPVDWSKLPPASKAEGVTFAKDIQPLLKASCVQCHGEKNPKARLNLTTLEGVLKGTKQGSIVKPGDSANSFLVKSISQLDPESAMPPKPRGRRGPGGPGGEGERPQMRGDDHGPGERPLGAPQGTNAPNGQRRNFTPPKPLTAEQVGLVRAWIDQGAK
jgi:cytochrome c